MKTLLLLSISAAAFAQDGTRIGAHQMGETFQQWLTATPVLSARASEACNSRKRADKAFCGTLASVRDSGGWFYTTDGPRKYGWRFKGGILYELNIEQGGPPYISIQEEIGMLAAAYGEPRETTSGALWTLPDGGSISIGDIGGKYSHWIVFIDSAQLVADYARERGAIANPYRP